MAKVYRVEAWDSDKHPNGVIRLYWEGKEGFGQYDLVIESNPTDEGGELKIVGDSECMDSNEDRKFLASLLDSLLEKVTIEE